MTSFTRKWDERFLSIAQEVSKWSKDPSTKVGAVIVDQDRHPISVGYNGFPKEVFDDPSILGNREEKFKYIVHAEKNVIDNCPTTVQNCILYVTHPCCGDCAQYIIDHGIKRVVMRYDYMFAVRWNSEEAINKLVAAGVEVIKL